MDGYYVTLWRLLLKYPEILAWDTLWNDSLRETYQAIYKKVKSVKPTLQVGWHIWHNNSFNPIYRAHQDLTEISKYSDYLKMVMYHNCGGERMASYIDSVSANMYGDVPKQELLDFHYRVMNYQEKSYAEIPKAPTVSCCRASTPRSASPTSRAPATPSANSAFSSRAIPDSSR